MNKREPLPAMVVEAARHELAISAQEAAEVLAQFDPGLAPAISSAVFASESNKRLRAALNRVLYVQRNATFAQQCKIELEKAKVTNE